MAISAQDIWNGGLANIGENPIVIGDLSKADKLYSALYLNSVLYPTLCAFPWNALTTRAVLTQPTVPITAGAFNSATNTVTLTLQTSATISAASWASNSATLTIGAHSLQVGMQITVASVSPTGYNGNFTITAVTATTILVSLATNPGAYVSGGTITWVMPTLGVGQTITITGINPADWNGTFPVTAATANSVSYVVPVVDAYVSGGYALWQPPFQYSNYFYLPADCVRVLRVNGYKVNTYYGFSWPNYTQNSKEVIPPFKIEGNFLLTNESSVSLKYIQFQNPPQDPIIVDLLIKTAASELAYPMARSESLKASKDRERQAAYMRAKNINTNQGTPDETQEDDWISARK